MKPAEQFPSSPSVLAELWPDLVDNEQRWQTEIPFLGKFLTTLSKKDRVLDLATGAGSTSIGMLRTYCIDLVCNEIDPCYRKKAVEEARKYRVHLGDIRTYNWTDPAITTLGTFDLAYLTGNSFCCLFDSTKREVAMRHFAELLGRTGTLVIDEREYPAILKGTYDWGPNTTYCGEKVQVQPAYIAENLVIIQYDHLQTGVRGFIHTYPLKQGEIIHAAERAGLHHRDTVKTTGMLTHVFRA